MSGDETIIDSKPAAKGPRKRTIVQFHPSTDTSDLTVLCSDGRIFFLRHNQWWEVAIDDPETRD